MLLLGEQRYIEGMDEPGDNGEHVRDIKKKIFTAKTGRKESEVNLYLEP